MRRAGDPEGKHADSCPLQWLPIEPFESSSFPLLLGEGEPERSQHLVSNVGTQLWFPEELVP